MAIRGAEAKQAVPQTFQPIDAGSNSAAPMQGPNPLCFTQSAGVFDLAQCGTGIEVALGEALLRGRAAAAQHQLETEERWKTWDDKVDMVAAPMAGIGRMAVDALRAGRSFKRGDVEGGAFAAVALGMEMAPGVGGRAKYYSAYSRAEIEQIVTTLRETLQKAPFEGTRGVKARDVLAQVVHYDEVAPEIRQTIARSDAWQVVLHNIAKLPVRRERLGIELPNSRHGLFVLETRFATNGIQLRVTKQDGQTITDMTLDYGQWLNKVGARMEFIKSCVRAALFNR